MGKTIEDRRDPFKLIEGINHPRQAIVVDFVNPTDAELNPRWRARSYAGTLTVYADDRLDGAQNAMRAAVIFCEKYAWDPRDLVSGTLPTGSYVFTLNK